MEDFEIKKIQTKEISNKLIEIPDCPKEMYYVGKMFNLNKYKIVTIVGSRTPSIYARQALEYIISGLKGAPIVVVSGLALGIDALAHSLALKNGLKTIAVPGSGLHPSVLYPKTNFHLARKIIHQDGLLLSEFESNQQSAKWTFPKRNRIMAGLADLVFVVEAKEKSGTLITARLAVEYNRDLAVLPCSIFNESCKGNLQFLKLGAYPIVEPQDILELLNIKKQEKDIELTHKEDLSSEEMLIIEAIRKTQDKEEIIKLSGLDVSEFQVAFSKLELRGIIKEELGKVFLLA